MNVEETIKGFTYKQIYSWLDKDPDTNIPKFLDFLESQDKDKNAVAGQVASIKKAIADPNSNWAQLMKSLWTDIDDGQRKFMYELIHKFRGTKPIFTMDFWNDGDAVGGCIAGGRGYCHINANGDVEPCAFIHYSNANIKEKTLLEAYQQPLFMAYRKNQPFNKNMLRPCPVLDNPGRLTQMVEASGAYSTDLASPEKACDYCNRCVPAAKNWAPVAAEIWDNLPNKRGVQYTGKMAKKS